MKKIEKGAEIRVRDNEPDSLFGPIYGCHVAKYDPDAAITIKHQGREVILIDTAQQPHALQERMLSYVVGHAQAGLIINLGTLREMTEEHFQENDATPQKAAATL